MAVLSLMKRSPEPSTATPHGPSSSAAAALPPSPLRPVGRRLPATVVITPLARFTSRTRDSDVGDVEVPAGFHASGRWEIRACGGGLDSVAVVAPWSRSGDRGDDRRVAGLTSRCGCRRVGDEDKNLLLVVGIDRHARRLVQLGGGGLDVIAVETRDAIPRNGGNQTAGLIHLADEIVLLVRNEHVPRMSTATDCGSLSWAAVADIPYQIKLELPFPATLAMTESGPITTEIADNNERSSRRSIARRRRGAGFRFDLREDRTMGEKNFRNINKSPSGDGHRKLHPPHGG